MEEKKLYKADILMKNGTWIAFEYEKLVKINGRYIFHNAIEKNIHNFDVDELAYVRTQEITDG